MLLLADLEEVEDRQTTAEVRLMPIPVSIEVIARVTSRGAPHPLNTPLRLDKGCWLGNLEEPPLHGASLQR